MGDRKWVFYIIFAGFTFLFADVWIYQNDYLEEGRGNILYQRYSQKSTDPNRLTYHETITRQFSAVGLSNSDETATTTASHRHSGKLFAPTSRPECIKQILYWLGPRMKLPYGEYFCRELNCKVRFISRRSYAALESSHAVILHHTGNWDMKQLQRGSALLGIYMSRESPLHSRHGRLSNVFNWTMTYRPNSDFPIPYGIYEDYDADSQKRNRTNSRGKNWANGKAKMAVWIASNCRLSSWPQTLFARNLSRHMDVDMFGKCGDRECPGGLSCLEKIRSYKFYFAFENSRCTDYVTEKMWRNSFLYDAVPIVYGTSRENYQKLAPPHSFIHVSDFPNITSLVAFLKLLDADDSMYNKYFEWKYSSYIEQHAEDYVITEETLCSIAAKLLGFNAKSRKRNFNDSFSFTDMNKIWFDTCLIAPPLPLSV